MLLEFTLLLLKNCESLKDNLISCAAAFGICGIFVWLGNGTDLLGDTEYTQNLGKRNKDLGGRDRLDVGWGLCICGLSRLFLVTHVVFLSLCAL